MISLYFNNTICERDMDLLFVESLMTDSGFTRLVIDKTDLKGKSYQVLSAELSKSDSDLGESDITFVIEVEGIRHGLLIEDKIDAIAMPKQHDRYIKRGEKGVKAGEYSDFRVFLFCPEKYYNNDTEAKLYKHVVTYEECKAYFDSKNDALSILRSGQLHQALTKAKKPATGSVNEKANAFLRRYIAYQKEHFPTLMLVTKEDKNGWWPEYRTELGNVYIYHKAQEGFVDLMFPNAQDMEDKAKIIADWLRRHKFPNPSIAKAKKSVMIRIHVPKLDMLKDFDNVDLDELHQCFEVIQEMSDFANIVERTNSITDR